MRISTLMKLSLAALIVPPALWLAGAPPGVASLAGLVAGVALVAWGWTRIAHHRAEVDEIQAAFRAAALTPRATDDAHVGLGVQQLQRSQRRLDRTPTGRQPRDVRCPTQRAPRIARRSTRR